MRGAISSRSWQRRIGAGLYTNLITSAVGIALDTLRQARAETGLDHVQISIQDSERASADRIGGYEGAYARKCALAAEVIHLKIPLTVNAVMHRANIDHIEDMVALALSRSARAGSKDPRTCNITAGH